MYVSYTLPDMMTHLYCSFLYETIFTSTGNLSLPALFTCTSFKRKSNTYVDVYAYVTRRTYADTADDYYYSTYYGMYLSDYYICNTHMQQQNTTERKYT